MKKITSLFLSLILLASSLFVGGINAFADTFISITDANGNSKKTIAIVDDITDELVSAFDYCKINSTANNVYVINIPNGAFEIKDTIFPCDNTTVKLNKDTTLINAINGRGNIFCSTKYATKYNGLTNFSVIGGTMTYASDNKNESVLLRFAHCKDILIKDVSFLNGYMSHFIEIAASKDVLFEGCSFEGFEGDIKKSSSEAIQIDILEETTHFASMPEYDGTMNDNITVNNCVFKNLISGVGTNSIYEGYYQTNIKVTNNTFTNLSGIAVNAFSYVDSEISNNTMKNCGTGIKYFIMKTDGTLKNVCFLDDRGKMNTDCNSVIKNNRISTVSTEIISSPVGIQVFGNEVTKSKNEKITPNNYYVSNIKVLNNTVDASDCGIKLEDVINSTIENNSVSGCGGNKGISLNKSSNGNSINNNAVSNFENNIYLNDSKDNRIKSNSLSNSSGASVSLMNGSSNISAIVNTLENGNGNGFYVSTDSSLAILTGNIIRNMSKNGVNFVGNAGGYVEYNKGINISKMTNILSENPKSARIFAKNVKKGVEISWNIPKDFYNYEIYRKEGNTDYQYVANVNSTDGKFVDKAVKKNTTYSYKIVATKYIGNVVIRPPTSNVKTITYK